MSSGTAGAILFLITAGLLLTMVWRMSAPEHQEEDDIKFFHTPNGWGYHFEDISAGTVTGAGFLTKYHAKRAARLERDRIAEGRHRGTDQ